MEPGSGGAGSALMRDLWNSSLVSGVAFHPRKCSPTSGRSGWIDSHIKAEDGTTLAYRLYKGSGGGKSQGVTACVLVYFHANAELCTDLEGEINSYRDCGYSAVLCPEFRGFAWSTGKPQLGSLCSDAEAFMKALPDILASADLKALAAAPVVVLGRSLGSACAVHVASGSRASPSVAALIIESGVVKLLELPMVQQLAQALPGGMHLLRSVPEPLGTFDKLAEVTVPTVIIHGERDEVSPFEQAQMAYEACGSSAKRIMSYPRCRHNDLRSLAGPAYYQELQTVCSVASGTMPQEELLTQDARARGLFGALAGALRCVPGVRRCFLPPR